MNLTQSPMRRGLVDISSFEPSTIPTLSLEPSAIPTLTMIPSTIPTLSSYPTSPPTGNPSSRPSASPSILPTHQEPSEQTSKHELMIVGIGLEEMNPDLIETVMENIEDLKFGRNDNGESIGFIDDVPPGFVDVNATFIEQTRKKGTVNEFSVGLTFNMKFSSRKVDVEGYLDKFIDTMKSDESKNILRVTLERDGYIPKGGTQNIKIELFQLFTSTPVPIAVPTNPMPTASPTSKNSLVQNTIVSAGIAGIAIFLLLVLYFLNPFYKKRKQRSEERNIEMVISVGDRSYMSDGVSSGIFYSASNSSAGFSRDGYPPSEGVHEPEELLSVGHSDHSDSNSEQDERNVLVDEFEEFQNPSLEKMRTQVEENVVNSGGMMSEAITREFLKEYDSEEEDDDLKKIFHGNAIEIEAGVLCETNDWLKRKQGASIEDRRDFMQKRLNEMVKSVVNNSIAPEEASRSIHGCAAMLDLQLAENIPETALIVTGMRKKVKTKDLTDAFKPYGDIQEAAVAPKERGFGVVRYRSQKSVNKALQKCKEEEIVVQDVAVMVRVLCSSSAAQDNYRLPSAYGGHQAVLNARSRQPVQENRVGKAAHHGNDLDSLGKGYNDDSLGGEWANGRGFFQINSPHIEPNEIGSDCGNSIENRSAAGTFDSDMRQNGHQIQET